MTPPRPTTTQPHYGEHLGDASYWAPYVIEVLERHGLRVASVQSPFVGTFPTFLVGDVVVKLFADTFDGGESFAVEHAMHGLLVNHPEIPAPQLVCSGQLFDDEAGWSWPYLVTGRLGGIAIRDAALAGDAASEIATQLGGLVARLHAVPAPEAVRDPHFLAELRACAPARLERSGLPDHLVQQVPEFLADASDEAVLVHADITADHVFVDGGRLVGVIDWGDAMVADPWYELVAIRFDSLRGERGLFTDFLDGYGWRRGPDFSRRAMQGALEFQFSAISAISGMVDLAEVGSLDELAHLLFHDL